MAAALPRGRIQIQEEYLGVTRFGICGMYNRTGEEEGWPTGRVVG